MFYIEDFVGRNTLMADSKQPTLFTTEEITAMDNRSEMVNGNGHGKWKKKIKEPLTSKQQLSSIIKSVRDDTYLTFSSGGDGTPVRIIFPERNCSRDKNSTLFPDFYSVVSGNV